MALSPSPRPSAPPAASAITFFAAAQSSTPTTSSLTYTRKQGRVDRVLELGRQHRVLARDHRGGRQPLRDLLRDVRPREHGDRPIEHERGEALARRGVEALRQREHGRAPRQRGRDGAERRARDGQDDELRSGERSVGDRRRVDAGEIGAGEVAGVAVRRLDRPCLLGVAAGERHLVAALGEDAGEGRPPRPSADDDRPHERGTKSIETGTPARLNRLRSSFSIQYA